VQSWRWFYPHHYAPFASDLINIDRIDVSFPPSQPFKPVDQLMGVFPPSSAHALPEPCRWYMRSRESPIADFYPASFDFDPNGKTVRWLWIALLPFIDEKRLLKVTRKLESKFSERDRERNECNPDLIFAHAESHGAANMAVAAKELLEKRAAGEPAGAANGMPKPALAQDDEHGGAAAAEDDEVEERVEVTPTTAGDARAGARDCGRLLTAPETGGVSGYFMPAPARFSIEPGQRADPPSHRLEPLLDNKVAVFEFKLPKLRTHLSRLLPGVKVPRPTLSMAELMTRPPRLGRGAQVGSLLIEQLGPHPSLAGQGPHPPQHMMMGGPRPGVSGLAHHAQMMGLMPHQQQMHMQLPVQHNQGFQQYVEPGRRYGTAEVRPKQHRGPGYGMPPPQQQQQQQLQLQHQQFSGYGQHQQMPPQHGYGQQPPPYFQQQQQQQQQSYQGGHWHQQQPQHNPGFGGPMPPMYHQPQQQGAYGYPPHQQHQQHQAAYGRPPQPQPQPNPYGVPPAAPPSRNALMDSIASALNNRKAGAPAPPPPPPQWGRR
jgi:hypothetical protein